MQHRRWFHAMKTPLRPVVQPLRYFRCFWTGRNLQVIISWGHHMEETHCQVLQSMDVATLSLGFGATGQSLACLPPFTPLLVEGVRPILLVNTLTRASLLFSWNRHLVEMGRMVRCFKLVPLKKLVLSLVVFLVHSVQTTVWTCQQAAWCPEVKLKKLKCSVKFETNLVKNDFGKLYCGCLYVWTQGSVLWRGYAHSSVQDFAIKYFSKFCSYFHRHHLCCGFHIMT